MSGGLSSGERLGLAGGRLTQARGRPRPRLTTGRRDELTGYLLVAPQIVGYAVFVAGPTLAVLWFSLLRWDVLAGTSTFIGLGNYSQLLRDPVFAGVVGSTVLFSVGLVVLNLSLALGLALLINQRLRGTVFFRTLFFSPVVISLVAWTIVWRFLLQANGGINEILQLVGVQGPNWLREPGPALISVVVVQVFKNVGLNMVLFLVALQGVPDSLYEAARLDGAGSWQAFRRITLPLISPAILLTMTLTVIGSLQVFAQIQVLTAGGPGNATDVLVYYLYRQAFQYNQFGYAGALAVLLFVVVLALTVLQWRLRRRWVFDER